jgi:phosphoesterase, MJ0936 family
MRLLVVSDTHGEAPLPKIAELGAACDLVIHLGDGFSDGQKLVLMQPNPVIQVLGNADLPLSVVPEKIIEIEGWTILLTHGHLYGVKRSLVDLIGRAEDMDANLVLFGHIHRRVWEDAGRIKAFCPSSAAYSYDGTPPSVGILDLKPGEIHYEWITLN